MENKWKQFSSDRAFEYSFLDETFAKLYQSESRFQKVFVSGYIRYSHCLSRTVRSCNLCCTTKSKRNRHSQSTWRFCYKCCYIVIKGFFKTCFHFFLNRKSCCMVCGEQMVAGFCLSY